MIVVLPLQEKTTFKKPYFLIHKFMYKIGSAIRVPLIIPLKKYGYQVFYHLSTRPELKLLDFFKRQFLF